MKLKAHLTRAISALATRWRLIVLMAFIASISIGSYHYGRYAYRDELRQQFEEWRDGPHFHTGDTIGEKIDDENERMRELRDSLAGQ